MIGTLDFPNFRFFRPDEGATRRDNGLEPPLAGTIADYYSSLFAADASLSVKICTANPATVRSGEIGAAEPNTDVIVALTH